MYNKLLLFLFLSLVWSCKKTENTRDEENPATSPIKLETLNPEIEGSKGVRFVGRVLNLNSDKIIEHGFVLYTESNHRIDSTIHIISSPIQSGNNSLLLNDILKYDSYSNIEVKYFVKTSESYYSGEFRKFVPSYVTVVPHKDSFVQCGQLITVSGDFKNIDQSYKIYSRTISTQDMETIPYTLNNSKTEITFNIPNSLSHGDTRRYVMSNRIYADIFLGNLVVVGSISTPNINEYYYSDILRLTANHVKYRDLSMPFQLIVGNKGFNYNLEIPLADVLKEVKGTRFKWGYFAGADTVFFPSDLVIKTPTNELFQFKQRFAHPFSTIAVSINGLERYIPVHKGGNTLGGKGIFLRMLHNANDELTIGDVPEGSYPVIFKNGIIDFTSSEEIRIEKLRISSISQKVVDYNHHIIIKGNFIDGQNYTVITNRTQYSTYASNGTITIIPANTNGNKLEIKNVGYSNSRGQNVMIDLNASLELIPIPIIFDGFYPKEGNYDTKVTLNGKGLFRGQVFVAGHWIPPIEITPTSLGILLPRVLLPGKYKIAIFYNNEWHTVDDHFEVKF